MARDDELRTALERAIGFQYDIIGLLGRGGMGAVYHAHEKALDRAAAIKVLPPDAVGGEARERFLREARTAARLTHPNIVPLFTFGETQGLVYYVMGYVDGESLEQRLRRGPLDPESAKRILEQLAGALDYAHQQGIVHRDVKPDNVLIERGTGVAKLTDFGIAKRTTGGETLTGTGLLMGTPRYMSPEQASGDRELDARSDVYALGLVGYAMLVGRPPFDGGSVQEILTQQVTRDAPSLRKLFPDLESGLVATIDRALRKEPARRWPSAGDMAAALGDEEGALPDSYSWSKAPSAGTYALLNASIFFVTANVVWYMWVKTKISILPWLLPIMLLGGVFDFARLRWADKKSPAEIKRVFTEPPRWWPFWWPARWRRRDDIWHRLPKFLRQTRIASSIAVGSFVVSMELIFLALTDPSERLVPVMLGLGLPLLAVPLYAVVRNVFALWRWGKRQGLTTGQADMLVRISTSHSHFWKQPWTARFLAPAAQAMTADDPATPAALVAAVEAILPQLPSTIRERVNGAGEAARELASAVEVLDGEIAALARDVDPTEVGRLESRITALGPADSTAQREMRQLYSSQLELLKKLSRQSQDLSAQRSRYIELLRTLWRQLQTLRTENAADALRVQDITGRVKHIVDNVDREVRRTPDATSRSRVVSSS